MVIKTVREDGFARVKQLHGSNSLGRSISNTGIEQADFVVSNLITQLSNQKRISDTYTISLRLETTFRMSKCVHY